MYSQDEISDAVEAGALAPEQAASLRSFVAARNRTPHSSEEYLRVSRGYNDVFVTYACVMVLVALGWLGTLLPAGSRTARGFGPFAALPFLAPLLVAVGSWLLAELFVRIRRTALPGFVLAITFGLGVAIAIAALAAPMMTGGEGIGLLGGAACAIAAAASWGFWQRFRVPVAPAVAIGLGVIAIFAVLGVIFARSQQGLTLINVIMFLIGIGLFVYAMTWDLRDRWRVTLDSDVAFWLHSGAATLLSLPLAYLISVDSGVASVAGGIAMLVLFVLFTLIGLVIDRKGYVVACLFPLVNAINSFFQGSRSPPAAANPYGPAYAPAPYGSPYGGDPYAAAARSPAQDYLGGTMLTILIIGLLLVLLAVFWGPLRRAVVGILPPGMRASLPGTDASPFEQARPFE